MLKSDLKQIKQIVDESLDKKLDEKLDEKLGFVKNEIGTVKNEIGNVKNELLDSMKEEFDRNTEQHIQMNEKLDRIDQKLETKADETTLLDWADKRILRLESDRNKVKYLHIKEWKNLPSASKIKATLVREGIK